jgi:drug/metabolite transporter (DMT)-like permease
MTRSRAATVGWLSCASGAILFGASTPAVASIITDTGPMTLAGLLYVGAAIGAAVPAARGLRTPHPRSQTKRLAVAVVLGGGVAPVLLMLALHRTPSGTVSLLLNLELVATALIARWFLREHLGTRAVAGVVIVLLGGVVLAGPSSATASGGALLVVGACVCWGIDNAVTASVDTFTPSQVAAAKGLIAGTVNLAIGAIVDGWPPVTTTFVALGIGVVGYGLSIMLWVSGARRVGAARAQAIAAISPFVGALLAGPITGHSLRTRGYVAFAISLAGAALVMTGRHTHLHAHGPATHNHRVLGDDLHHNSATLDQAGPHHHDVVVHEHEHLPDVHHRHEHGHSVLTPPSVTDVEEIEEQLPGGMGSDGAVVRVGETVRRPRRPETDSIHRFLHHLEQVGFSGAPRVLGFDDRDRAVLTYIEGDVGIPPFPAWIGSEELLVSVAELQREMHHAARSFAPSADDIWDRANLPVPAPNAIVCHNDLCVENVVALNGRAIAFIDFDFAAPNDPLIDIAIAARHWVPLRDPVDLDEARRGLDQVARFHLFCDAHQLDEESRNAAALKAMSFLDRALVSMKARADAGRPLYVAVWEGGYPLQNRRAHAWIEASGLLR